MTELRNLWPYLLFPLGIYLLLLAALYFYQSRLLYYPNLPSRKISLLPDSQGMAFDSLEIITSDGIKLHGWFLPVEKPRVTLLFFHGNAGNISHRLDSLKLFNDLGVSVLIFDYRGYGLSEGTPSEKGTYHDAEAAWHYLTENLGVPSQRIILFGRSMGGPIAAWLAARTEATGLILESTFTSVPDMASEIYPFFPVKWLSRFRYDTLQQIRSISSAVLVIHSRDDEIIPFAHGHRLYERASEPKHFLEISGGHNDGFLQSESHYKKGLEAFIEYLISKQER
ncbi:MAG: alpha/beta hydrolase [Gammaproteobacteria bacterium]|nr:alpha/beta hydrolase [Gammaproteobacteria bacterium]